MIALVPIAVAAAGAVFARGYFSGYPKQRHPSGILSSKEQAIVAAAADTFFPKGGPIPISGTDAGLVEYFDDYVAGLPETQRHLVRLLLVFVEHGPWVFGPKPVRFTSLSERERELVLERMRTSPIYFRRIAFLSMRTMLTMGYLANPLVAKAMRVKVDTDPFRAKRAAA